MNAEEALMLLDRICENDSTNNDTCTYDVDPIIALNSVETSFLNSQDDFSLEHFKDCTILIHPTATTILSKLKIPKNSSKVSKKNLMNN